MGHLKTLHGVTCISAVIQSLSLRVVLDVAHVWDEARQLVEADLVNIVTAHAV